VVTVAVNPVRLLGVVSVISLINMVLVDDFTFSDDLLPQYLPINASLDICPSRTCKRIFIGILYSIVNSIMSHFRFLEHQKLRITLQQEAQLSQRQRVRYARLSRLAQWSCTETYEVIATGKLQCADFNDPTPVWRRSCKKRLRISRNIFFERN